VAQMAHKWLKPPKAKIITFLLGFVIYKFYFWGMIELLNIDCLEYMATCKDKQFDLAIVDPIYGVNESAHRTHLGSNKLAKTKEYHHAVWAQKQTGIDYFNELFRVSRNQIIWGGNYFGLPGSRCWIVWDKNNSADFADAELAYTSFDSSVRIFKYTWNGMLQENMKDKEMRIHPTQKPVQLYKWLLKNYATPDMRIIDTHLGSGSSAIAAYDFGCDFVGMEIDKEYFDAAKKRFDIYKSQGKLF
jgi:site-specific DNA-methyltransferase (adenine-specific)